MKRLYNLLYSKASRFVLGNKLSIFSDIVILSASGYLLIKKAFDFSISGWLILRGRGGSTETYWPDWVYTSSPDGYASTTKVTGKPMRNIIGKPYRGEPDLRFYEGTKGNDGLYWATGQALKEQWRVSNTESTKTAHMH